MHYFYPATLANAKIRVHPGPRSVWSVLIVCAVLLLLQPFLAIAQPAEPKRVSINLENDVTSHAIHIIDENSRASPRAGLLAPCLVAGSVFPSASVVSFPTPSLGLSHSYYTLAIIAFCLLQSLVILGLLWQRATMRKSERSLRERLTFEDMLSELSAKFITVPDDQIEATIEKCLGSVAEFLKFDRITLYGYSSDTRDLQVNFSWRGEGVRDPEPVIKSDQLPWWCALLARGESLLLSDVALLPPEAIAEQEHLKRMGAVSIATIPLRVGDALYGAMSFVTTKRRVLWTEDLVKQLNLLVEIFSNARARGRALDARFRHAAIVESSDDAIVSRSMDGTIVSWNAAAERLFGYGQAEAMGQPITMIVPCEQLEEQEMSFSLSGRCVEHHQTVRLAKGGRQIAVMTTVSSVKDSTGKVVGFSEIVRDISDRIHTEQLLRESEARFRLVADSSPVLIWMSGTDKMCTFFNQSWLNFTGRRIEEELGDGWTSTVHPEDLANCLQIYSTSFDARVDFEMEYRLRRQDGQYRWIVNYGVPRFEPAGDFCGFIGSCVDITERKMSEESLHTLSGRLITAQEEERARIARELHDDFSQRLALLGIGLSQLWKKLPKSGVEERESVREMLEGAREMSSDLHSLSHQLHSSKLEHVGLVSALKGLCKDMSDRYSLDIHFSQHETPGEIPKDVALCLFRVAQGALGNVVRHSESREARVELHFDPDGINLRIVDQGRGFDLHAQNSTAGIGLIGMNERLRLVGGKLLVTSEVNRGTDICASVPLGSSRRAAPLRSRAVGSIS